MSLINPNLLSLTQLAEHLKITRQTISTYLKHGHFPPPKLRVGANLYYSKTDIPLLLDKIRSLKIIQHQKQSLVLIKARSAKNITSNKIKEKELSS